MRKEKRRLKVCEQSGYRYKPTPTLMLKGAWLEEWGFTLDMPVSVQCEEGRLIITPMETANFIDIFEEMQLSGKVAEGMVAVLGVCMMTEGFWYFNILGYLIYLIHEISI